MARSRGVTWDGAPIASDKPHGACVVVYRKTAAGVEFLVLHRSNQPIDGDWAWTPPTGARQPGESPEDCAKRELREEAGLSLDLVPTDYGDEDWLVYAAEADSSAKVTLDAEHDRFEWVPADEACARCLPEVVTSQIRGVAHALSV